MIMYGVVLRLIIYENHHWFSGLVLEAYLGLLVGGNAAIALGGEWTGEGGSSILGWTAMNLFVDNNDKYAYGL